MHERPGEVGYVSLSDEPRCLVCEAVLRYCPGHGPEGRNFGGLMPHSLNTVAEGGKVKALRAGENWGYFSGDPIARWAPDGARMYLMEPFSYTDRRTKRWTAPINSTLDGASIPRFFWRLVGSPFRGKYRYASIIHDYHCNARVEKWDAVHFMFYEACMAGGCGHQHSKILYYAVRHFGPKWGSNVSAGVRFRGLSDADISTIEAWVALANPSLADIDATPPALLEVKARYARGK
jgi:Protein of unknown function (DUF1353)